MIHDFIAWLRYGKKQHTPPPAPTPHHPEYGKYYVPDAKAAEALRKQLPADDTSEIWFHDKTINAWLRWW